MLNPWKIISVILCLLLLNSCSNGTCSSTTNQNLGYTLGILPNNSIVWSSSDSFETPNDSYTSGVIGLNGGTIGASYLMSFSVDPTGPDVVCSKNPCVLTSGTNDTISINFNGNNQPVGIYTVTVYYTELTSTAQASLGTALPNTIKLTLNQNSNLPGNLMIAPFNTTSLEIGESMVATISLSNSSNITEPILTTITPNNANITLTPTTCSLTTDNNSCQVTIEAINAGISDFNVMATGYDMVTSESILINNPAQFMITSSQTGELNNYQTLNESLTNLLAIRSSLGGIAQKDNTIVATGFYGAMFNSHDNGTTWKLANSNVNSTFTGIGANATHFFAIADRGTIIRSNDGEVWQSINNISGDTYPRSIGIDNNTLVVVGVSGLILVSQDNGNSWENKSLESITTEIRSVAHSGNNWVAVGGITSQANTQATIAVSHDNGISWHNRSQVNSELQSVATIGNGIFTAVGSNGLILVSTDNGDTWTSKSGSLTGTIISVAGNGTTFIAVGGNPGQIGISTDSGSTWARNTTISFAGTASNVNYSDNKWVIAANNGQVAMSTDNGANWSFIINGNLGSFAYRNTLINNNHMTVIGSDSSIMYSNNNGNSWESKSLNQLANTITGVTKHNNHVVAAGNGSIVLSVNNGSTWNTANYTGSPNMNSITNKESLFVAVGYRGTVFRSIDDGQNFESIQAPISTNLMAVKYNNNHFVAVGRSSAIANSNDNGLTWESHSIDGLPTTHFSKLAHNESTFITVGNGSVIIVSHDNGNTWSRKTVDNLGTVGLSDVIYNKGEWIITGEAGTVLKSSDDGNTWHLVNNDFNGYTFNAVSASDNTLATVSGNKIFVSHDNGDTWVEKNAPIISGNLSYIASKRKYFFAVGTDGGMVVSNDYGDSWQLVPPISGSIYTYIYAY